jgi:D-alanine-D-alanine ligase
MTSSATSIFKQCLPKNIIAKIWVLAPIVKVDDEQIDYYYDFSQSIAEYTSVFNFLTLPWKWQEVNMITFKSVIDFIDEEKNKGDFFPIVLNLCDGDEINGAPGISVIKYLEEKGIVYTGADEYFYDITTSKIPMKKAFDKAGVPNAPWSYFFNDDDYHPENILSITGTPLIVKPAISGGSMGVGIKNVVETKEELSTLTENLLSGYRGWNLNSGGFIAERFINGPEFTVFISGSFDKPENAVIYTPVERIFHHSLPDKERFLSFERLWEVYETESAMPEDANFYEYGKPEETIIDALKKISWDAFVATKGKGYTRVDIRQDAASGKLYVLELNAQCGISEDENFTSIGAIIKATGKPFSLLVEEILVDAVHRGWEKLLTFIENKKQHN